VSQQQQRPILVVPILNSWQLVCKIESTNKKMSMKLLPFLSRRLSLPTVRRVVGRSFSSAAAKSASMEQAAGGHYLKTLVADNPYTDVVQYEHQNRTFTVNDIEKNAEALAIGIAENGLQTGDVVLSYLPERFNEQVRVWSFDPLCFNSFFSDTLNKPEFSPSLSLPDDYPICLLQGGFPLVHSGSGVGGDGSRKSQARLAGSLDLVPSQRAHFPRSRQRRELRAPGREDCPGTALIRFRHRHALCDAPVSPFALLYSYRHGSRPEVGLVAAPPYGRAQ
jgi:hypothetical protein